MLNMKNRLPVKETDIRLRLRDRLVYVPGALILLYGFWLSLTV